MDLDHGQEFYWYKKRNNNMQWPLQVDHIVSFEVFPPKTVNSESDISIKTSNLKGNAETERHVKAASGRMTSNTQKKGKSMGLTTPVFHKEITIWG